MYGTLLLQKCAYSGVSDTFYGTRPPVHLNLVLSAKLVHQICSQYLRNDSGSRIMNVEMVNAHKFAEARQLIEQGGEKVAEGIAMLLISKVRARFQCRASRCKSELELGDILQESHLLRQSLAQAYLSMFLFPFISSPHPAGGLCCR